jgi:pyruvate/2-oxoglutarate dehydrogenase complex dihydrolipoamide acyltransferase (E2) component
VSAILIPHDLWDDDSEGAISIWFYETGDLVTAGTVVAEVMNEKVSNEVVAPISGKLEIVIAVDHSVNKGTEIGRINSA